MMIPIHTERQYSTDSEDSTHVRTCIDTSIHRYIDTSIHGYIDTSMHLIENHMLQSVRNNREPESPSHQPEVGGASEHHAADAV